MLIVEKVEYDDLNSIFKVIINTDIPSLEYKVDGTIITSTTVGGINQTNISYNFDGKEVYINATGESVVILKLILRKSVYNIIDPEFTLVDVVETINLINSYEVYLPCGETNILLADDYDRGLNDGLILGQYI